MKTLKQTIVLSSIGIFTLAGVALAHSLDGSYAGKSKTEITTLLQDQGYEVRDIEVEDDLLEAYAMKDGMRFEIYVDPNTGNIVKVEEDD